MRPRARRSAYARRAWLTGTVLVTIGACSGDVLTLGRAPDDIVAPMEAGPETGVPDTSIDGPTDGGADADTDAGRPEPPTFVGREPVNELDLDARSENPTLTRDGQEIFFMSTAELPDGGGDLNNANIWTARRLEDADGGPRFGEPVPVDAVNTPGGAEQSPALSPDGLTLWFAHRPEERPSDEAPRLDIYRTTRSAVLASDWEAPVLVAELNGDFDENPRPPSPLLVGQERIPRTMPMASRRDTDPNYQNYFTIWDPSTGEWGPLTLVQATFDEDSENVDGFLSDDELIFYFASNRNGQQDIFCVTRASRDEDFEAANVVRLPGDVNDPVKDERDPWVSPDGRTMYFVSIEDDRDQIFVAYLQE